MNLKQISKNNLVVAISIILVVFLIIAIFFNKPQNNVKISLNNMVATTTDLIDKPARFEDFSKYNCDFTSNVGWTECIIEKLDRAASEREWKQRKLEKIKSPEVNEYNMTPELSDEVGKIRKWRETFEVGRDAWCDAKLSFRAGSGTPARDRPRDGPRDPCRAGSAFPRVAAPRRRAGRAGWSCRARRRHAPGSHRAAAAATGR